MAEAVDARRLNRRTSRGRSGSSSSSPFTGPAVCSTGPLRTSANWDAISLEHRLGQRALQAQQELVPQIAL